MNTLAIQPKVSDYSLLKDGDAFRAPLSDIDPVPWGNIRKSRDKIALNELRMAIRAANGVTQGVTVRINPEDPTRLQLLAGYGRVECSHLEGMVDIPAVFKVANDKQAEVIMLSENLDRESLSIADEIIASQRFISHFDGDYEAAAAELNWSVKRLRGRLTLNQCTEKVMDALREKAISIGHAEILSAFIPKLQDGTLDKIITEKWTIEYLKERAGKANRWLKNAIFDTADCSICPHNSDVQAELFDNTVGKSKCNNLVCYKEKTDLALSKRKSELEDEHGVVLLAIEKPECDRNTVSGVIVGTEQFSGGCTGCVSNVAILKDGINADAGEVKLNQCIDTECFRKMKSECSGDQNKRTNPQASKTTNKKSTASKNTKNKDVTQKTPSAVIENNKAFLRSLSAAHFDDNVSLMEALCVSSLMDQAGFSHRRDEFEKLVNIKLSSSFNTRVMELYVLPSETLEAVKKACYSAYLSESNNVSTDPRSLLITALANDAQGRDIAVAGWKPTKEVLGAYLKQGLLLIADKSGFKAHYDSVNGEGSFSKIAKQSKGTLIDAILGTHFDWSGFAPEDYIKCLN
jgi:ParB family transcriptional regulator, chromosome partitioning protein